jgi:hypothetical protein
VTKNKRFNPRCPCGSWDLQYKIDSKSAADSENRYRLAG